MQRKILYLTALGALLAVTGCSREPASNAPAGAAAPMSPQAPHPMPSPVTVDVNLSGIEKAGGGVTIAELYAAKNELAGQPVAVRGKVVKLNPNIMGTNWLHVRDGSGEEGSNNLTITSDKLPAIGDTVLVNGILQVNKDLGMGYQYEVIIEQPEITVETRGAY